jgi:hypothetical protein
MRSEEDGVQKGSECEGWVGEGWMGVREGEGSARNDERRDSGWCDRVLVREQSFRLSERGNGDEE